MKIAVVGAGKVGYSLTEQLSKEGHDIVVIDSDGAVLDEMLEHLDVMTVLGNGALLGIQKEAGVPDSDLLIAATANDEINLLCCILAKKLGCRHTISRVKNPEYMGQIQFLSEELGLSMTVNPEQTAAREIFRLIQFPSFLKRDSFARGKVELVELKLNDGNPLIGKQLFEIGSVIKKRVLVCTVERGGRVIIPKGNMTFENGDKITVTAPRADLVRIIKSLNIATPKIKNVIIVGGSSIGVYLTEELLRSGVRVKIIEKDRQKCLMLAERLPDAIIINGDGSKQELLSEEGVKDTDAVITLTNIDEENIIVSLYAAYLGVPKTITKINRTEYTRLFDENGIGSVICPKELTTNEILRYVRATENTSGSSVVTLHRMIEQRAEALEFIASPRSAVLDKPLSTLRLKSDVLIACIARKGQIIIPGGNDEIVAGDTVIAVTPAERTLSELDDILEKE